MDVSTLAVAPPSSSASTTTSPASADPAVFADALERAAGGSTIVGHTTLGGMLAATVAGAGTPVQPAWAGLAPPAAAVAAPAVGGVAAPATRGVGATSGLAAPAAVAARLDTGRGFATPVSGRVSSRFGHRTHPTTGAAHHHSGVDVAAPTGTPVAVATGGRVVHAGDAGGYGLMVEVDHGGGVVTRYAHLSRLDVRAGQELATGERLGAVGSTGRSTGPHLHLELRLDGTQTDPAWLLG